MILDIAMSRDNYRKFLACAQRETDGHSFVGLNYNQTMDYCGETRVVKYHEKFHNVYIDIFILDYAKTYQKMVSRMMNHVISFLYMAKLSESEKAILKKRFKGSFLKQTYLLLTRMVNSLLGGSANTERLAFYLRASKTPTNMFYLGEYNGFFPVNVFRPAVFLRYEDSEYPCPCNYEYFLKRRYGNWESYPKEGLKWLEEEKLGINL